MKTRLTREELSRIRAEAGRKGAASTIARGHSRGGRPKGATNKTPSGIESETRSVMVLAVSHGVFQKCANAAGRSMIDFMSVVADGLKRRNPQLFALRENVQV